MAPETVTIQTGPEIDLTVERLTRDLQLILGEAIDGRARGPCHGTQPVRRCQCWSVLVGPWAGIPGRERFTHCIARSLAAFAGPGPPGRSSVCSRLRLRPTSAHACVLRCLWPGPDPPPNRPPTAGTGGDGDESESGGSPGLSR